MTFSVDKVKAEIRSSGVLRSNKFDVTIPVPRGLVGTPTSESILATGRVISLYGESAQIPGVAALTHDVRRYGYGPTEKKPVGPLFTDWPVVFRSDASGEVHDFFRQWVRLILNQEVGGPQGTGTFGSVTGPIQGQRVNELAYKEDYAVDAAVTAYADNGSASIVVILRDCYPIHVGDAITDWSRANDYLRFPVTFTYFDWSSASPGAMHLQNQG